MNTALLLRIIRSKVRVHQDTFCPCPDYIAFTPDKRFMVVPHHSFPGSFTTIQKDASGHAFLKGSAYIHFWQP